MRINYLKLNKAAFPLPIFFNSGRIEVLAVKEQFALD